MTKSASTKFDKNKFLINFIGRLKRGELIEPLNMIEFDIHEVQAVAWAIEEGGLNGTAVLNQGQIAAVAGVTRNAFTKEYLTKLNASTPAGKVASIVRKFGIWMLAAVAAPIITYGIARILPGKETRQEIRGQVFIALENRETIRLSAVPILAVEESIARARMARHTNAMATEQAGIRIALSKTEEVLSDAKLKLVATKRAISNLRESENFAKMLKLRAEHEAWKSIPDRTPLTSEEIIGRNAYERRRWLEPLAQYEREFQELERLEAELQATHPTITSLASNVTFLSEKLAFYESLPFSTTMPMPEAVAASTSDAEGGFSFSLPQGRFVLMARCSRKAIGRTEELFWLVPLKQNVSDRILLNNANLLTKEYLADFLGR